MQRELDLSISADGLQGYSISGLVGGLIWTDWIPAREDTIHSRAILTMPSLSAGPHCTIRNGKAPAADGGTWLHSVSDIPDFQDNVSGPAVTKLCIISHFQQTMLTKPTKASSLWLLPVGRCFPSRTHSSCLPYRTKNQGACLFGTDLIDT